MGKSDERRLRDEMADWSDSELLAVQIKEPGLARDVAAQQIRLDRVKRSVARETVENKKRNLRAVGIGIAGLVIGSVGTFYTYRAYVQQNLQLQPAELGSKQGVGIGFQTPASSNTLGVTQNLPAKQAASAPK